MIQNMAFSLLDVGASGGVQDRWASFTQMSFYGFEPDDRGQEGFQKKGLETWFNIGVAGESGQKDFYLTKAQCNSSLIKPNRDLISRLAYDLTDFDVVKTLNVKCQTLNQICAENSISPDMVKLDTQGSELEILKAADNVFKSEVLAAEIEVEFLPLYENQPLFADVDSYMRSMGFQLMDLGNQLYVKGKDTQDFGERKGQLVSADALYVRSVESFKSLAGQLGEQKWQALLPICKAYGIMAYAYEVLKANEKTELMKAIEAEKPSTSWPQLSERKYASIRRFFEKRIKPRNANWNYGLGNPSD